MYDTRILFQVMREEFRTQQPQLTHLTTVGESVLSRAPSSDVQGKLTRVTAQWADLLGRLDERLASLGAAADTSREFDAQLVRLRDTLQGISDQLDDIPLDREPEEQLRKVQVGQTLEWEMFYYMILDEYTMI